MSTDDQPSLGERVRSADGSCPCPKCGVVCPDMHAWIDHVSDAHDVYGEFVDRWGGVSG